MRQNEVKLDRDRELEINRVFYGGDKGGILCDVTPPGLEKTPLIFSLTHLKVGARHPLGGEIRAYQWERAGKLSRAGREPTSFAIEPRKRRRR